MFLTQITDGKDINLTGFLVIRFDSDMFVKIFRNFLSIFFFLENFVLLTKLFSEEGARVKKRRKVWRKRHIY